MPDERDTPDIHFGSLPAKRESLNRLPERQTAHFEIPPHGLTPSERLDALEYAISRSPDTQNLRDILSLQKRLLLLRSKQSGRAKTAEAALIRTRIAGLAVPTTFEKIASAALVIGILGVAVNETRFIYDSWMSAQAAVNDINNLRNNVGITNALPSFNRAMTDLGTIGTAGLSMVEHTAKAGVLTAGAWITAKVDPIRRIRTGLGTSARVTDKLTTGK